MWLGIIILFMTIFLIFASGTYSNYKECEPYMEFVHVSYVSEYSRSAELDGPYTLFLLSCISLKNDLYLAYAGVIVGVALMIGGYIER